MLEKFYESFKDQAIEQLFNDSSLSDKQARASAKIANETVEEEVTLFLNNSPTTITEKWLSLPTLNDWKQFPLVQNIQEKIMQQLTQKVGLDVHTARETVISLLPIIKKELLEKLSKVTNVTHLNVLISALKEEGKERLIFLTKGFLGRDMGDLVSRFLNKKNKI